MKTQQGTVIGLVVPLFFSLTLRGQEPKSILVRTTKEPIHIDGVMDEPAWQRADTITDFWLWFPDDTSRAKYQTQIFMLRDAKNIYVAAKCFAVGDDYIIPGLRRDFRAGGNDNVSLLFDTFNDETNAFLFGLNPLGVQREALISSGGLELENFATAWDNVWEGDAKIYEGYYLCEFSIPFRTLRYNEGVNEWNFNSYRFDAQYNEQSTWNRIPRNQWIFSLAHMGKIIWEDPLPKSGANISLIPYVRGGVSKDQPGAALSTEGSIGMDAKVAVTPGLNLDLTVNPDFSQVESDEPQVTVNERFEVQYPERRPFFVENADFFATDSILLFTRRIVDPELGLRFTGRSKPELLWDVTLLHRPAMASSDGDLFISGMADQDTTLAIRGPDGLYYCNDDAWGGLNPALRFSGAQRGIYQVWLGRYGVPAPGEGQVFISTTGPGPQR